LELISGVALLGDASQSDGRFRAVKC
jgi:hypothetical protein